PASHPAGTPGPARRRARNPQAHTCRACRGGRSRTACPAARGRGGAGPCAGQGGRRPCVMSAPRKSGARPAAATQAGTARTPASKAKPRACRSRLKPAQIDELFSRLRELNPHPTTELEYSTPFELLVAVALSAQATDVGVNKATRRLFPVANTPAAILALGEDGLKQYINTIGLYNAKAANVIATCRILLEKHGGEVPRDREALEALPGVGRKT